MKHVSLAVKKYQERAAFCAEQARIWSGTLNDIAKYYQRESAIDYSIARNLMGVEDNA